MHDLPILPRASVAALASFFSTALKTAAVFSLYCSVSFFQLFSSPLGGLFLPRDSPNALSSLAPSLASSHLPSLTWAPTP